MANRRKAAWTSRQAAFMGREGGMGGVCSLQHGLRKSQIHIRIESHSNPPFRIVVGEAS